MNRRTLFQRIAQSNLNQKRSAHRLDHFRPSLEPLEERQLLSAVTWTLNSTLSGLTTVIPDRTIVYNGFNISMRFANQSGSVSDPWTTNSTHLAGTMTTDYTDGVAIDFNNGANSITAVGIYSVRPNPADYQDFNGTTGLFTGTSSAVADVGGKLLANGVAAAFIAQNDETYDINSPSALPITGSTFPIAGSNLNIATLTGNLLVDGTSIFLIGQILPDTILSATGNDVHVTNVASSGTVTSLGGNTRQLTVPVILPLNIEVAGQTITGTILGQLVATATIASNTPPVVDLGNAPNYSTTWNYAPVAIENTATATVTDDSGTLASMTVSLGVAHAGNVLAANTSGTPITQSWNGTSLVLSGVTTAANYQQVLRTITYNNTLGGPGVASETATFTAVDNDGTPLTSAPAVATITITPGSTLTGARTFYNNSARYDTVGGPRGPLAVANDNAIATDKSAYLPGGATANFGNYTSYSRGTNGIMVDLKGGGNHTSITLANILNDFTFRVGGGGSGSNTTVPNWVNAPLPTTVNVRTGMTGAAQGVGTVSGSDRIELIWADGAIKQQWLEVIVKATPNTGLASNTAFLYGNAPGNTAVFNTTTVARTGASDVTGAQTHGASLANNIPITNIYDFDRDGKVNANDVTVSQTNGTSAANGLKLNLNLSSTGPFAPDALPSASPALSLGDVGGLLGLQIPSLPSIPPALLNRLGNLNLDLNTGPIAKYFEKLAHEATDGAKRILKIADDVADFLHLDHDLLDSLCDRLGIGD